MNKFKKIIACIKKKNLTIKYLISEKWYVNSYNKYLKYIGCNLDGKLKYIARDVKIDYTDPSKIHIGDSTVITSKVTILVHDYSIECGLVTIGKENPIYESLFIKDVYIGKNCFIGQQAFIKPGTVIGDNCIIGSCAVVSGKIPGNSIVIGNPGVIIKKTDEWANKKLLENEFVNGNKRRK